MTSKYQRFYKKENNLPEGIYYVTQLDQCEHLWKTFISPRCISDLWEFRLCFHKHFQHKPVFLVVEDHKGIAGLVPMSYVQKLDTYCMFPGEMWNNRTWLERTPVYVRDDYSINDLLKVCPENSYLRYLEISDRSMDCDLSEDETGYVMYPGDMDYNIDNYFKRFSNKKFKAINKVIRSYSDYGYEIFLDRLEDYDRLVEMSIQQFGSRSFMYDIRFQRSFNDVLKFLNNKKMLRMISCVIDGELAAVDIGGIYKGIYTVFLGGTDNRFPGIAKFMNMNHIQYSFSERLHKVDFLCGDFHWKLLWHLDQEVLYRFEPFSSAGDRVSDIQYTFAHMSAVNQ